MPHIMCQWIRRLLSIRACDNCSASWGSVGWNSTFLRHHLSSIQFSHHYCEKIHTIIMAIFTSTTHLTCWKGARWSPFHLTAAVSSNPIQQSKAPGTTLKSLVSMSTSWSLYTENWLREPSLYQLCLHYLSKDGPQLFSPPTGLVSSTSIRSS